MKAGEHVVFVAKRKHRRSHVLLRAFRHESLDGCEWDCSSESVNKLLLARKPEDFILAVGSLFPLSVDPLSSEEADFHPRAQTVRQFKLDHENLYEPVSSTAVRESREPKATFHSQWSRLLLETAFHSNKLEARLCKNCARPMLSKTRGMRRMFCSDSCRVAFTNSYRKETQAIETNAVL